VEGVVAAMRAHGGQEHVQCAGCLALMALVRGEGDVARACQWRVVRGRAAPLRAPGMVNSLGPAAVLGQGRGRAAAREPVRRASPVRAWAPHQAVCRLGPAHTTHCVYLRATASCATQGSLGVRWCVGCTPSRCAAWLVPSLQLCRRLHSLPSQPVLH